MGIPVHENPIALFDEWLNEAKSLGTLEEPTAMTLATVDDKGMPWARVVLLKGLSDEGFDFYTNLTSPKAKQLTGQPRASLCFYWMPLGKQVRVQGSITPVTDAEADAYFASRSRESQLGAWASRQSSELESRDLLEERVKEVTERFADGPVPRPEFWSGFRLRPFRIEFWKSRPHRLHDRLVYTRDDGGPWSTANLYP